MSEQGKPVDPAISEAARYLGRRGGLKGGPARAKALTPKEREEVARMAAFVRWGGNLKALNIVELKERLKQIDELLPDWYRLIDRNSHDSLFVKVAKRIGRERSRIIYLIKSKEAQ